MNETKSSISNTIAKGILLSKAKECVKMSDSQLDTMPTRSPVPEDDQHRQEEILNEQQNIRNAQVGFFHLYRDATRLELSILAVSAVLAIAGGAILPIMTVQLPL
jgi:hypothetical protein